MSFTFNWPRFSDQFHYDAIQMLNTALNKGNKPPIIADKIEVVELEMGTQPPELEIRDIGDLTTDQFRGIFRMTYNGDAHLVLKTKVQANPLNHKLPDIHQISGSTGMLAAQQPLVVPMLLRLSHFRMSSYVVLVVSKQKGITIVFKTDPLQNVDINSTFDSIAVIQSFIQREIEGQLRQMFREDLPSIIHRLSQQWVKAKVETPYQKQNQSSLRKAPTPTPLPPNQRRHSGQGIETMSTPELSMPQCRRSRTSASEILPQYRPSLSSASRRPRSTAGIPLSSRPSPLSAPPLTNVPSKSSTSTPSPTNDPEDEPFDPTYGLRPEGLPTKPVFKAFGNLFTQNKGLADLAEESVAGSVDDGESDYQDSSGSLTEEEDFESNYDFVDWRGTGNTPPEPAVEYEAIPAIGGGTVTRPRVIHSQSQIQSPPGGIASAVGGGMASSASSRNIAGVFSATNGSNGNRSGPGTPGILSRNPSNPYFTDAPNSAPPIMDRPGGFPSMASDLRAFEGNPMKRRSMYAQSVEEEVIYTRTQGINRAFPHPYDIERHRYEEERYEEGSLLDDDGDEERLRRIRAFQERQQHEYLTMHTSSPPPSSIASSPPRFGRPQHRRRLSVSSNTTARTSMSGTSGFVGLVGHHPDPSGSTYGGNPKIVLQPSLLNNSIHHLSALTQSNHTLSPYTRSLEHFAVRSGPPRAASAIVRSSSASATAAPSVDGGTGAGGSGNTGGLGRSRGGTTAGIVGLGASTRLGKSKAEVVVKARRKRTYRIGGAKKDLAAAADDTSTPLMEGFPADETGDGIRRGSSWSLHDGAPAYGGEIGMAPGKGKERQRTRHRRRSRSPPGTDFEEEDMDRYFKSLHAGTEKGGRRSPKGKEQDRR